MNLELVQGLLIPFLGTSLGAACVFFMRKEMNESINKCLVGFAAGVMMAASIWSLLIPAMEHSAAMGSLSFLPAVIGLWLGILFLLAIDHLVPHLHAKSGKEEGLHSSFSKKAMVVMAIIIHNIPEGIATGVVFASWLAGMPEVTFASAIALAIGIAIQNFPEGAIVSMPLKAAGASTLSAFGLGVFSGAVEPIASLLTIVFASTIIPFLPYLLAFAAGAMIYVVIEELIPDMATGKHSDAATVMFAVGFSVMMILDVALS